MSKSYRMAAILLKVLAYLIVLLLASFVLGLVVAFIIEELRCVKLWQIIIVVLGVAILLYGTRHCYATLKRRNKRMARYNVSDAMAERKLIFRGVSAAESEIASSQVTKLLSAARNPLFRLNRKGVINLVMCLTVVTVGSGTLYFSVQPKQELVLETPQPRDSTEAPKPLAVVEPEMVTIPAGSFQMGDQTGKEKSTEFPHEVRIPKRFMVGKYEVTFEEYRTFAAWTDRELPDDAGWGRGRRPVINVDWADAVAYAEWLSEQTGKRYRLPTEAEWEYVARAGTEGRYWWCAKDEPECEIVPNVANWSHPCENAKRIGGRGERTMPVGSFQPNPWGLHDTAGNVWEWVQDCWHDNYRNAPADGSAWEEADGGNCGSRVLRGGSWMGGPPSLRRVTFRAGARPDKRIFDLGFRLARDL